MPAKTGKRLILHIGAEKTGTTAIQESLFNSRKRLAKAGYLYPVSLGNKNHTRLITYSQDNGVVDNIRARQLQKAGVSLCGFRRKLISSMTREVENADEWDTMVLSCELIHSRLVTRSEVKRLLDLILRFVDSIQLILFVRRQDALALSRVSSALRSGHADFDGVFASISDHHYYKIPKGRIVDDISDYYDYTKILDRFSGFIPDNMISLVIYPESSRKFNSISEFEKAASLPAGLLYAGKQLVNSGMSVEAQYIIAQFNTIVRQHGFHSLQSMQAKAIRAEIENSVFGAARTASRNEAMDFYNRFRSSNDTVAKRYLGQRKSLFSNDFAMYPHVVDYSGLTETLSDQIRYYCRKASELLPENNIKRSIWSRLMGSYGR